jgi:hypothetical protein
MKRLVIATAIAVLASSAWAQKSPSGNTGFDGLDKNRDGYLSKEEIAGDKEMAKRFVKFDTNKDGRWTLDDFIKAHKDNDSRVVSDSGITTKVKTALLTEKAFPRPRSRWRPTKAACSCPASWPPLRSRSRQARWRRASPA